MGRTFIYLVYVVHISQLGLVFSQGRFWQISDFHTDISYANEGYSCYKPVPISQRGRLGNEWCDAPWELVNSAVDSMKTIDSDVDFIIWTGDNVFHAKPPRDMLNASIVFNIIENVTSILKKAFPTTPIYPVLGNHDFYPKHLLPGVNNPMYERIWGLWEPLIGDGASSQANNFKKSGFYTIPLGSTLRLVALNTNLYYYSNTITQNETDPGGQFAWLQNILKTATNNNQKIMVVGHVPPGIKTLKDFPWFIDHFNQRFIEILQTYGHVISAMYFGHDHRDTLKIFETEGRYPIPTFLSPSVTPWRKVTSSSKAPAHNPGIRLVKYDILTGEPLDISQYFLKMDDVMESEEPSQIAWQLLYNFTSTYNVKSVSGENILSIWKDFARSEKIFDQYYRRIFVNASAIPECDKACKALMLCAIRNHFPDNLHTCKEKLINGACVYTWGWSQRILTAFLIVKFV